MPFNDPPLFKTTKTLFRSYEQSPHTRTREDLLDMTPDEYAALSKEAFTDINLSVYRIHSHLLAFPLKPSDGWFLDKPVAVLFVQSLTLSRVLNELGRRKNQETPCVPDRVWALTYLRRNETLNQLANEVVTLGHGLLGMWTEMGVSDQIQCYLTASTPRVERPPLQLDDASELQIPYQLSSLLSATTALLHRFALTSGKLRSM